MIRIVVLIILAHLTLSGTSQIASDSITCLPNYKLRKAIRQIEDCKVVKEELALTKNSVFILESRIELKNQIIRSYEMKDSLSYKTIENLESISILKDKQILNGKTIEAIQGIKIKTLKINKWIYGGVGLIIGFLVSSIK